MLPNVPPWEWLGIKHILFDYSLHNQALENVQSVKYLVITITDNMDWSQHISEISSKAAKTLGFLRRNLAFAPKSTKEVAYKTMGRPKLEYAAPIWSPYSKLQINQVEKVQRTAARWTCRKWRNPSSVHVGEMLDELEWPSLDARMDRSSLLLFHQIHSGDVSIEKTSTRPLLTVWNLPRHHTVSNIVDTRHTAMPWRTHFPPDLFHSGMVFLLRWSIPRLLRSF